MQGQHISYFPSFLDGAKFGPPEGFCEVTLGSVGIIWLHLGRLWLHLGFPRGFVEVTFGNFGIIWICSLGGLKLVVFKSPKEQMIWTRKVIILLHLRRLWFHLAYQGDLWR